MYNAAMRRAQTLGGAFDTAVNTMYERQEENKAFGSKLKALEAMLQTHSSKFGLAPADVRQFLSVDPNESPKERYLRVGGFIEYPFTWFVPSRSRLRGQSRARYDL
jgi:hypothetical protein